MRSTRWVWVTALAVLFAGITNAHAHLHLCFDGQEPPASMHLGDESAHAHGHDHRASHDEHFAWHGDHHGSGHGHGDGHGDRGNVAAADDAHADGHPPWHDTDHDDADHAGDHTATHDDADVDLENQALAKFAKHDDIPALTSTLSWPHTFGSATATLAANSIDLPPLPRRTYSLPLSRAPPR